MSSSVGYYRLRNLCVLLCMLIAAQTNGYILNQTLYTTEHRQSKFTIDDLLNGQYSFKISDDIDMDPCKADGFMGDIAVSNINYESEWQSQKLNKTFQQELERMKQEVYHEGLQVEEEGLTDIIRKKTKLPHMDSTSLHEPSKNDAILLETNQLQSASTSNESSATSALRNTTDNKNEENQPLNVTAIDVERDNNSIVNGIESTTAETVTEEEKFIKNDSVIRTDIDYKKIQSNTKDIEVESTDNILQLRRIATTVTTTQATPRSTQRNVLGGAVGNGSGLDDVQTLAADTVVKRRHRRRRRNNKHVDKTYQARLERLKEELTSPTVAEIMQMHKENRELHNAKQFDEKDYVIDEVPLLHVSNDDQLSKKTTTMRTAVEDITTQMPIIQHTSDDERLKALQQHHRVTRAATAKKERIWDYGVIPYEIDANFSGAHKALFKQAMRHWENFTCIKFVERNPVDHPNFITFTIRPCGCCSFVGKRGNGGQAISIGKNCDKFGIVVHELGHVVGFWHEHTRPDRENHVVIERANIMVGQEYNFNKLTSEDVNSLGLPYDYDSIMHYARNTFSKGTYLDTILPVEMKGKKRPEIGQRLKLSEGDIAQANLLYKCSSCGRTFQENSGTFHSPSYSTPNKDNQPELCEWRITATHGERIVLNITDLDIFKSNNCRSDYLEIRDGYWHKSPVLGRYCGSGKIPELIKSTSSRMMLSFVTSYRQAGLKGFSASYEAVCGGDVNLSSGGLLESPNYPLEYLPNKECIWRITVEENFQVALKFQSFEVENHDNCVYDYVEVRDGDSPDSRLIGVFCGYKVPPDMRSTSNKMFVKFVSDSSVQKAGFSATFIKELDECELQDHGCEHNCVNTLGGYLCSCFLGYELHSDKKSCENACGGLIEGLNGTITSPSFPDVYPISKDCIWEIVAPEQYRITLNFTHFDLEGNNFHQQECDYDSLSVYSKLDEDNLKRHGIFCGQRLPPLITSEGNSLRIEFKSDNTVQKSGFAAVFFTDIDECAVNNGGCMHECKNTIGSFVCSCHNGYLLQDNGLDCKEGGCKYEITAPNGQIYSPNYPDFYPRKKDCVWHFTTTPGHRIRLHFTAFEMEPHQECAYDHIAIYNGDSTDSFTLGKFCGSKLPHPISASTNEMLMVFKSDASIQRHGFAATHSTACGGHLRATNAVKHFYSHTRFGDNNYDNSADCDWTIEAERGRNVHLTFLTFDIEDEKSCAYDFVDVYGGLDDYSGPLYGRYCGVNKPPDIISINEALLVRFRSDGTMTLKGFSVSYVSVEPFVDSEEEIHSDSSEMATPFPGYMKSIYATKLDNEDNEEEEQFYEYGSNFNTLKEADKKKSDAEVPDNLLVD